MFIYNIGNKKCEQWVGVRGRSQNFFDKRNSLSPHYLEFVFKKKYVYYTALQVEALNSMLLFILF